MCAYSPGQIHTTTKHTGGVGLRSGFHANTLQKHCPGNLSIQLWYGKYLAGRVLSGHGGIVKWGKITWENTEWVAHSHVHSHEEIWLAHSSTNHGPTLGA